MQIGKALRERILTGVALAVPALIIVRIGPPFLSLLALCLYFVAAYEYFSVVCRSLPGLRNPLVLLSAFPPIGFFAGGMRGFLVGYILSVLFACMISVVLHRDRRPRIETLFPAFSGLIVPVLLGSSLYMVSHVAGNSPLVLWLILGVVASDTFAFFGGRTFRGPKLAPELSPNKTISGAIVGFIGCLVVLFGFGWYFSLPLSLLQIVAAAVSIGILAQVGDLVGSMIKRIYTVKDYGSVLPGHGGVTDRIVALYFAAPVLLLLV